MPYTGPMPERERDETLENYLDRLDEWDRKEEEVHQRFMSIWCPDYKDTLEVKEGILAEEETEVQEMSDTPSDEMIPGEEQAELTTFDSLFQHCMSLRQEMKDARGGRFLELKKKSRSSLTHLVELAKKLGREQLEQVLGFLGYRDPLRRDVRSALERS